MSQIHKHTIPANIADRCLINPQQYEAMYQQSINAPDTFWGEQGKILDWITPYLFCRTNGGSFQAYLTNFSVAVSYNMSCLSTKSILNRRRKKVERVL